MRHSSPHPDLWWPSGPARLPAMATTHQEEETPIYVVIAPNYWGKGSTVDEAKRNLRKEGGKLTKYIVYRLPQGTLNAWVHPVHGGLQWEWKDDADTSLKPEIIAKRGVK